MPGGEIGLNSYLKGDYEDITADRTRKNKANLFVLRAASSSRQASSVIADATAIHTGFIIAQARDVEACLLHRFCQGKLFSKQWRRIELVEIFVNLRIGFPVIDPCRVSVIRIQQGRLKPGCLAPWAGLAVLVPDPDLPVVAHGRGQFLALIHHLNRLF